MHHPGATVVTLAIVSLGFGLAGCSSIEEQEVAAQVWDQNQQAIDPDTLLSEKPAVFIFTRTDCPISNRYAPTVAKLHETFHPQGVPFYLVYADHDATDAAITKHIDEFAYPCAYLRDPDHLLVGRFDAKITPEAFVVTAPGNIHYRGRINDRFVDFGKERAQASQHDLQDALAAVLEGRTPPIAKTEAIGCRIPPRESK